MSATDLRAILTVWARPDSCLEVLAATGAILPGCSTEVRALLEEVGASLVLRQGLYLMDDFDQLGQLWEWIERTGPRPAQTGWARAHVA